MVLGKFEVLRRLRGGSIVISPFNKQQLGPNSYDVRLGNWYFKEKKRSYSDPSVLSLLPDGNNPDHGNISALWEGPFQSFDQILVPSGQTVLAHTVEVVGGRKDVAGMMAARSTVARCGLCVCKAAGYGDVGYVARWTMELSNFTKWDISIPVGMRIAQIYFEEVSNTTEYDGKYGQYGDSWSPEDMLPKPELDWERKDRHKNRT